jgi:hypothetical protein
VITLLLLVLLHLIPARVTAQVSGTVSGSVMDASNAAVPGARVTLSSAGKQVVSYLGLNPSEESSRGKQRLDANQQSRQLPRSTSTVSPEGPLQARMLDLLQMRTVNCNTRTACSTPDFACRLPVRIPNHQMTFKAN